MKPQTLKFFARPGFLVSRPGAWLTVGQPKQYVGLRFDYASGEYVPKDAPDEFDANSPEGRRLIRTVSKEHSLIPADDETANAVGFSLYDYWHELGDDAAKQATEDLDALSESIGEQDADSYSY